MAPSYNDHPLYRLRLTLLISAGIGILFAFLAVIADSWGSVAGPYVVAMALLLLSAAVSGYDLMSYKFKEDTDSDNDTPWPKRKVMYLDLVFALLLQWTAWALWGSRPGYYDEQTMVVFGSYAAGAAFLSSIFHAICFWKELMGRKKALWLSKLPILPCSVCGATDQGQRMHDNPTQSDRDRAADLRARVYDLTPDDASESQILIQTDFDSSYGAIDHDFGTPTSSSKPLKPKKNKGKAPKVETL